MNEAYRTPFRATVIAGSHELLFGFVGENDPGTAMDGPNVRPPSLDRANPIAPELDMPQPVFIQRSYTYRPSTASSTSAPALPAPHSLT
jgi:hypothetical protein